MNRITEEQKYAIISRVSLISLAMVLGLNVIVALVGYIFTYYQEVTPADNIHIIRYALYFITLSEFLAIFIVKRNLISKIDINALDLKTFQQKLFNVSIIVSAICNAISIYGLVLVIMGDEFRIMFIFIAASLIAFQIFRIRIRDLEKF